jgi:Ca-activated chloride channel family protein
MAFTFGEPRVLWLLAAPAVLLLLWAWRLLRRVIDGRRLRTARLVPTRERFRYAGDLLFWLSAIASIALLVVAAARPLVPTDIPQRAGLDVIVLQDASASMRVADVRRVVGATEPARPSAADRWQRSMQFLRELGDALSWNDDRLAMVSFAHIAAPQIRLTRDPNTLFFFLDHLYARPPFRLEDDTTWDTNLEEAIGWGLRVVEKDEEVHGRSQNAAAFIMLSDGEAWSGEVARAVARVTERGLPLHVIGVGTLGGGRLPVVRTMSGELLDSPGISRLERAALQRIAAGGGGRYFELDRDADTFIANSIVSEGRRRAPAVGVRRHAEDFYWWFVAAGVMTAGAGLTALTRRADLAMLLAGSLVGAGLLAPALW